MYTWISRRPALLACLVGGLLSACTGNRVVSQVTSFHELAGQQRPSFAVVPFEEQRGTLAFKRYAELLGEQLRARGFVQKPVDEADVVALLSYSIDDGRERLFSYPVYGTTGVYTTTRTVTHSDGSQTTHVTNVPITGAVGTATSSRTEYTRRLKLELLDRPRWQQGELVQRAEVSLTSRGEQGDLARLMPTLIQALFENFPGANGQTVEVSLPLPEIAEAP